MAKILFLADSSVSLYKNEKELVCELLKCNDLYISAPYGDYIPKFIDMGCSFVDTSVDNSGATIIEGVVLVLNYIRMILRIKPDIILTYRMKPNIYGGLASRMTKVPCIANITALGAAAVKKGVLQRLMLNLYKSSLNQACCIFYRTDVDKEFLQKNKIVKEKQRLILNACVDLHHFKAIKYPDAGIIKFLFISGIEQEKEVHIFVQTAELITQIYQNTEFHIIGICEEAYEDELSDLDEKGVIQYHGMQHDIRKYYEFSHCVVHIACDTEALSNVLLESAACGRPVITVSNYGCEKIVDDGVSGFIIEQINTQELSGIVEKFLLLSYQEKKQLGLNARAKAEKEFDRRLVVNAYLAEIEYLSCSKASEKGELAE